MLDNKTNFHRKTGIHLALNNILFLYIPFSCLYKVPVTNRETIKHREHTARMKSITINKKTSIVDGNHTYLDRHIKCI